MRGRILQLDNRPEILPVEAEPPPKATGANLADIANSIDRLIGMQQIILDRLDRLESQNQGLTAEMRSNINAYMGWAQELVKAARQNG